MLLTGPLIHMALDDSIQDTIPPHQINHTPGQRLSRNDVHFPLTTPRKRNPSIPLLTHAATEDGQSTNTVLRVHMPCASDPEVHTAADHCAPEDDTTTIDEPPTNSSDSHNVSPNPVAHTSIQDLPEEILRRILDYILGDLSPVNAASTSTGLSHRMRHPRRKDVSELALICPELRAMVQERIYRHIKIKGTRFGLRESQEWFQEHSHLARHVRHIEYWVPVWGDKAAVPNTVSQQQHQQVQQHQNALHPIPNDFGEITPDFQGIQFRLSTYSATLSQIFDHLGSLFPRSSIFTLEGGHCKNSNMIKHFTSNLFTKYMNQQLRVLPNIKVFAMRGAWNIMRSFNDWDVIQEALPYLTEWHCGYAKPRLEAYNTINEVLLQLPLTLRHLDISLDSMFSKDDTILGSTPDRKGHHICEQLGRIAPQLESLSYTGRVCEGLFTAAAEAIEQNKSRAVSLRKLDIVVKSCCRQRVKTRDFVTGDVVVEELGGIMADGAGIGNLVFINAFERLVLGCINSLGPIHTLNRVKIRYIDLDSPCQQLNPYWTLEGSTVTGIWNDRIVERLTETRKGLSYERLEDGIGGDSCSGCGKKDDDEDDRLGWTRGFGGYAGGIGGHIGGPGASALYPRVIPKSINTASYKVIADARAAG